MPTTQRPFRLLRKFLWWVGLLVSVNVLFYIVIPLIAANYIKRQLETQGFTDVRVELGYPTPRSTHLPFLTLQGNLDEEHLSLTIRNLEITYLLTELLQGHVENITIERVSLELKALPLRQDREVVNFSTQESVVPTSSEPALREGTPSALPTSEDPLGSKLVSLARLLPVLPFESFSLGKMTINRTKATGPFRRMEMSGSIENRDGTLKGVMTLRGEKIIPYSLLVSIEPGGDIGVVLRSNELLTAPLLMLDSSIESSPQTGIVMKGSIDADLKQLTPFMALFLPLGSDLHKVDGSLHVDWAGTTSHDVTVQTLFQDPQTKLSGQYQLGMQLPEWAGKADDIGITVKGQVNALPHEVKVTIADQTRVTARLHSEALPLLPEIRTLLVDADDQLTIEVKDRLETTLAFKKDMYTWAVEGFLQAQYGSESSPLGARVTLLRATGDGDNLLETEGNLHTWGRVYYLPQDWPEVEKVEWDMKGVITSSKQNVEFSLAPASFIRSTGMRTGQFQVPESLVQLERPWRILYDTHSHEWKAGQLSVPLGVPRLRGGETEAAIHKAILHITNFGGDLTGWELNGKVMVAGIDTTGASQTWPVTNAGIGFWVNPNDVTLGMRLETLDKSVTAQGRMNHNFRTKQGNVFATLTPQLFSLSEHRLSRLLPSWPYPFDVTGGEISVKVSVAWEPENSVPDEGVRITNGEISLTARHLDGLYGDVKVQNVNTTLTLIGTGWQNMAMPVPAVVSVGKVNPGVQVQDCSFSMQLGFDGTQMIPTLDIKDFSARVFKGEISSPRIYFDIGQPLNAFVLKLDGLQVDEILQLEQQKNLEGTGVLKGFVPITLRGSDVEIKDGKVEAVPPGGKIRFRPLEETVKNLSRSNFNMDIVLQALSNFHYDVLAVGVNYAPDGTLKLHARLKGINPDLQQGQPIHFNMNFEENIPALFQSLRVVQGIEEHIDQMGPKPL